MAHRVVRFGIVNAYLVQEDDGTSKYLLEDGTGALLTEDSA